MPEELVNEITQAITDVNVNASKGSTTNIRHSLLNGLLSTGWSSEVAVSSNSEITITSVKNMVGLCLQTGNVARMYADLLKLQKLYIDDAISAAVMVVPSPEVAKILGSNITNSARLQNELQVFKKVIYMPIVLIAME